MELETDTYDVSKPLVQYPHTPKRTEPLTPDFKKEDETSAAICKK